jgi:hypothetical protein
VGADALKMKVACPDASVAEGFWEKIVGRISTETAKLSSHRGVIATEEAAENVGSSGESQRDLCTARDAGDKE